MGSIRQSFILTLLFLPLTKVDVETKKVVSNETTLEKDQITLCPCKSSVNSRKNHLEQGRTHIVIAQCAFSDRKDILKTI